MALNITTNLTGLVGAANGVLGGIVDNSTTDPLTVGAGVTLNGGTVTPLSTVINTLAPALGSALSTTVGDGIRATVQNANVTNNGTVMGGGTVGIGIDLTQGGTVNNTGAVSGVGAGITVGGTTLPAGSTVNNTGTVGVTATQNGIGVSLDNGTVTNNGSIAALNAGGVGVRIGTGTVQTGAGSSIIGALDGVLATAATTVDNAGTIAASAANGVGVNLLNGGMVVDTGTISGMDAAGNAGGVAVNLGGTGGSKLVLGGSAVMNGGATAAGTGNVLEIQAGATPRVLADLGTTMAGFDTTMLDAGASAVIGAITAADTVMVGNNASLTLGGPVAAGATIDLGGTNAKLTIGDPADFAGTIANLGVDDVLDLTGLAAGTTVSAATGGGLTITGPNGTTATLAVNLPVGVSLGLDPTGTGVSVGVGVGGIGTTVTIGGGTGTGGTGTGGTGTGGTGTGTGGTGTGGTGTGGTGTGGTGTGGTGTGTGTGGTGTGTGGTGTGTTVTTGSGTGTTVTTGSGGSTLTTTSPLGTTTTQVLPAGSTIAQGSGATAGDVVSIDPGAVFQGHGEFSITGHVAANSGVKSVTLSAVIDGAANATVLGTATVAADGSYTFLDNVGAHLQGFITATETDGNGNSLAVQSPYSLQAGLHSRGGFVTEQDLYTADGSDYVSLTQYKPGGTSRVDIHDAGQTFKADYYSTFNNGGAADNTFVFNQGNGASTINLFRANGADHDTISLPSADFQDLASVIANTTNTRGGAVITDPNTGDTIKLTGVSKAELKANPSRRPAPALRGAAASCGDASWPTHGTNSDFGRS